MNRDFEFKQLLRAYRANLLSETAFEQEMAKLEGGWAVSTVEPEEANPSLEEILEAEMQEAAEAAPASGKITLAQFEAKVSTAADQMIRNLEKFNSQQNNPEEALRSAASLRPRLMRYFRKLLSSEFEVENPNQLQQEARTGRDAE